MGCCFVDVFAGRRGGDGVRSGDETKSSKSSRSAVLLCWFETLAESKRASAEDMDEKLRSSGRI